MKAVWNSAKYIGYINLSPNTRLFSFEIIKPFDFEPGQFITFDLPISTKRLVRWKSYSIVNFNIDTRVLDLCITYVENGSASHYFFGTLNKGDTIPFKGPAGEFTVNCTKEFQEVVLICTGSGIAPFIPIIYNLLNLNSKYNIHLIFGTRFSNGILFHKELQGLANSYSTFEYSICLSKEPFWNGGYHGYVHQIYLDRYKELNQKRLFMLCGWQNMVDESRGNLLSLGYQPHQIVEELFG